MKGNVPWVASTGELNATGAPASDTISCDVPSSLVQVTVVPAFTVRVPGLKAKFRIVIAFPADGAGVAPAAGGADEP